MKRRAVSKRRVYPILSQSRFHQISDGKGWSTYWSKVNPTSNHEPAAASVGNWTWKKLLIWLKCCLFGEVLVWKQNKRTTCNSKARGFMWRSIFPRISGVNSGIAWIQSNLRYHPTTEYTAAVFQDIGVSLVFISCRCACVASYTSLIGTYTLTWCTLKIICTHTHTFW